MHCTCTILECMVSLQLQYSNCVVHVEHHLAIINHYSYKIIDPGCSKGYSIRWEWRTGGVLGLLYR